LEQAAITLQAGGVVAYPTEAVYGLGCDPANGDAIQRICRIKQRPRRAGLILVAAELDQLSGWIDPQPGELEQLTQDTPVPTTWIVTAGRLADDLVTGGRRRIAVRLTEHPLTAELCVLVGSPLISTSANRRGRPPARHALQVRRWFGREIDQVLAGATGAAAQPSQIRDALSGQILRP
jgi:L-threonylcarbamoyladenylate synthase